jgi:hypothetical protein
MISSNKFNTIFKASTVNNSLTAKVSHPNEENLQEFAVSDKATRETLFYTYDNRIYINANFDLSIQLVGNFEEIDGVTNYVTFQYDIETSFVLDLLKLIQFYDDIRVRIP